VADEQSLSALPGLERVLAVEVNLGNAGESRGSGSSPFYSTRWKLFTNARASVSVPSTEISAPSPLGHRRITPKAQPQD